MTEREAEAKRDLVERGYSTKVVFGSKLAAAARAFRRCYPRDGQPWKLSEDRHVTRADRRASSLPKRERRALWLALAKRLGRTPQAVLTRAWAMRAAVRWNRAARGRR